MINQIMQKLEALSTIYSFKSSTCHLQELNLGREDNSSQPPRLDPIDRTYKAHMVYFLCDQNTVQTCIC